MSFFKMILGNNSKTRGHIECYEILSLSECLEKDYIILNACCDTKNLTSRIINVNMIKTVNRRIISKLKINLETNNESKSNISSVTEEELYKRIVDFFDNDLKSIFIVVESNKIFKILKEGLEKYGYSGIIYYLSLAKNFEANYDELETKDFEECCIRMSLYYNLFIDEQEFKKSGKDILELQFDLINISIDKRNKTQVVKNYIDGRKFKLNPKYSRDYVLNNPKYSGKGSYGYYYKLWYTSYKDGHSFWLKGESYAQKKDFKNAIKQYDKARLCQYEQLNLYKSYAEAYNQLKEYDDEVVILDEGIRVVKGDNSWLIERRNKAYKLAYEAYNERKELEKAKKLEELRIQQEKEKAERQKYIEKLKAEKAKQKAIEKNKQKEIKQLKLEEQKRNEKIRNEIVLKLIKNPNACLIYRDIIKENEKINKIIDKLELKDNFEKLLWLTLIRIYENKNMPDRNERCYNINCYKDTNILKDKYINEYILNYFSKNKQNKDYYEVFEKKEKELDKEMKNKKLSSYARSTSVLYYVEFFAKIILRCIELISVIEIFEEEKELDKMYKNLITVTDDVKYITEKIYPIYKKCYASKLEVKVSKVDLEIVLYLKRKLADEIEIEITQKNKRQAVIKVMMDNYGKVLKKEEDKFIYVLIKLISYQNSKEIDEYINILKKVDEIIEKVNEKIVLEEAEQEKERILSGDLRKEVTLNRLKMTYASVTSPAEFEQYVADLYERLGYTIDEVVDKNKRGGADIIAFKDDIKYVIQVKYYTKPVNKNGIIEVVAAKKLYKANKGIHVTNSYYSMSAMQFAAQNNIELVDGEMIEEYISEISQKNNK